MNIKKPSTPSTCCIELRCDIRSIATIAKYFKKRLPIMPPSRGSLARWSVESFAQLLVEANEVEWEESTESALEILRSLGFSKEFHPRRRGLENFLRAVHTESLLSTTRNTAIEPEETIKPEEIMESLTKQKQTKEK